MLRIFGSQLVLLAMLLSSCSDNSTTKEPTAPPNVVLIFCDDLGYGDLACYGSQVHRTPNLDSMAQAGMLFTDFYVSSGVCTPSRSSLMTGSYPRRVDMHVNARPEGSVGRQVLFPKAKKGLNPNEITLAEMLKSEGYATACIGKWHLGDQPEFLPTRQGFDYYYGIPYSNDMNRDFCPLPLMQNETVIEAPVDQNTITKRYTEEAIRFMEQHKDEPFFVYLPHAMTHNPLHASEAFRGQSANGIYGDAVEEIDWSTGQILQFLENNNLSENTLVIFTSDNGAAQPFGGSNLPLRGWKGSTWEGGMRVPCLMQWKGTIPAGSVCEEMAMTIDILPTLSQLLGVSLDTFPTLDGKNIYPLMTSPEAKTPHEVFFYYQLEQLQAVRAGDWKLHLPLDSMYTNFHRAEWGEGRDLMLVNLREDLQEQDNVAAVHSEIVEELMGYAEQARRELGDLNVPGEEVRQAAIVENPEPLLMENQ